MNPRTAYLVIALIAALGVGMAGMIHHQRAPSSGQGAQADPADAQPAAHAVTYGPTLPSEFAILQTHNAFGAGAGGGHGAKGGPEATLVFKGVVQAGSSFTAFIENLAARQVTQAVVGDAVARGRIQSIDMDAIVYEVGADRRRIEVGQNFNGEMVTAAPTSQPSAPSDVQSSVAPPNGAAPGGARPPRSPKHPGA